MTERHPPDTAGAHEADPARPPRTAARRASAADRRPAAGGVGRGGGAGRSSCSGRWACCCACCWASAIVTQVRQNESGDSLETARPADLLVLLDSLQQREAALNTEVADLQRTLASLQASGSSDQAAIENAQARLAALSILIGTVSATGPGVTLTIEDTAPGVAPETMLDVINELRDAGAEAMEIRGGQGDRSGSAWTPGWSARPVRWRSTARPSIRRIPLWPLAIRQPWPQR